MKLIGVLTGEFEGHGYAKVICTENFNRAGCFGENSIVSKANYDYILSIQDEIPLYLGQEVICNYDRFGRVQKIELF